MYKYWNNDGMCLITGIMSVTCSIKEEGFLLNNLSWRHLHALKGECFANNTQVTEHHMSKNEHTCFEICAQSLESTTLFY